MGDIIDIVAIAVAVFSLAVSAFYARKAQESDASRTKLEKRLLKLEEESRKADDERLERERLEFALNYLQDIRLWADRVCFLMTSAVYLCRIDPKKTNGPDFFTRRLNLLCEGSALVDQGRWFFKNSDAEWYGVDKEEAYRGFRIEILDQIIFMHDLAKKLNYLDGEPNRLLERDFVVIKRRFVSLMQQILDPEGRARNVDNFLQLNKPEQNPD